MLSFFKEIVSLYLIVPLVVLSGLYLSTRLKWLQFTQLRRAWQTIFTSEKECKNNKAHGFSSFAALSAVLGGNLGTGNIAGIAIALTTGGPGALFWMWIMAALGAIIKFVGCYLGVKYRVNQEPRGFIGGPMYYLQKGLKFNTLAIIYAVVTLFAAFTVGNMTQINSIILPMENFGISKLLAGILMALFVAWIMFGGLKAFTKMATKIVPMMALTYIGLSLFILYQNNEQVLPACYLIFNAAFHPTAVSGGLIGFAVSDAIRVGFDRGLLATDAGIGLAPILHSQVKSRRGIKLTAFTQGLVSIVAPFIVMLICLMTGAVLIVTGAWQHDGVESTNMCVEAFGRGLGDPKFGHVVTLTLFFFAYTTILTWAHCGERAFEFLFSKKGLIYFRALFVLVIPLGAIASVGIVWELADIALNFMLLINMIGVLGLSGEVIRDVRYVLRKLEGIEKRLKANQLLNQRTIQGTVVKESSG